VITVTQEILDGVEQRTAYLLAGLEVPEYGALYKASFDGTTTLSREAPELPSGRALLAQLLQEGRSVTERPVQVAKEAAICELLFAKPTKGKDAK
jgi:hypothetical protein